MPWLRLWLLIATLLLCVRGDGKKYKNTEKVICYSVLWVVLNLYFITSIMQITVYVNKVGPYFNPQETYHYYSLPVCRPDRVRDGVSHRVWLLSRVFSPDQTRQSHSGRSAGWRQEGRLRL